MATSVVHSDRIRVRREGPGPEGGEGDLVLYWMQQAQRTFDNPALEHAARRANELGLPLAVVFCAVGDYPEASARHYTFLFEGLAEVATALERRGIAFDVLAGSPADVLGALDHRLSLLVMDRGYLPWARSARDSVEGTTTCRIEEVETDVAVPVDQASDHLETAARTIRRPLLERLEEYCEELTTTALDRSSSPGHPDAVDLARTASEHARLDPADPASCIDALGVAAEPGPVEGWTGGQSGANARLRRFLDEVLDAYDDRRNRFDRDHSSSELSPYLHFGQISPVRIVRAVRASGAPADHVDSFVDELVVRRELAINFVLHAGDPASYTDAVPEWARTSLDAHRDDERPATFTARELERGETDDPVWNAIMDTIRIEGWVHNQLRMYWGKHILRWTNTPEHAFRTLLELNNRWFLDGRDANSFANVAWCFGRHDQGFADRDVIGKVRPFTDAALQRKGDLDAWVEAASGS